MKLTDITFDPAQLKQTNLVFLRRKGELLLAMKKRGFGAGYWNGAGGKVEAGEETEAAARRETREELGVEVGSLKEVGRLTFYFASNLDDPFQNIYCRVYECRSWTGEVAESEEMAPKWFAEASIPYDRMWPDDQLWLPRVLAGERIEATFLFGAGDVILDSKIA